MVGILKESENSFIEMKESCYLIQHITQRPFILLISKRVCCRAAVELVNRVKSRQYSNRLILHGLAEIDLQNI